MMCRAAACSVEGVWLHLGGGFTTPGDECGSERPACPGPGRARIRAMRLGSDAGRFAHPRPMHPADGAARRLEAGLGMRGGQSPGPPAKVAPVTPLKTRKNKWALVRFSENADQFSSREVRRWARGGLEQHSWMRWRWRSRKCELPLMKPPLVQKSHEKRSPDAPDAQPHPSRGRTRGKCRGELWSRNRAT